MHASKHKTSPKTYYETLKLSRNCTAKEVRDAFILLSKKLHPDKNGGDLISQQQFIKVNEAYNVLIKPESRIEYDLTLNQYNYYRNNYKPYVKDYDDEYQYVYRDPWKDPSFARNRNFSQSNNNNYYGVNGIRKKTNREILSWLMIVFFSIIFLQIIIIRYIGIRHIQIMSKTSEDNRQYLASVKERAEMLGTREQQILDFKRRLDLSTEM